MKNEVGKPVVPKRLLPCHSHESIDITLALGYCHLHDLIFGARKHHEWKNSAKCRGRKKGFLFWQKSVSQSVSQLSQLWRIWMGGNWEKRQWSLKEEESAGELISSLVVLMVLGKSKNENDSIVPSTPPSLVFRSFVWCPNWKSFLEMMLDFHSFLQV